ncbi:MAG TPA: iron-containing alcohol dehydrogenase, partial [Candidatus Hydrogenedentes bacterium]|nr:iron-containing alcohol dehydrogenase [Candidatus Hydrogenedentota bacterium]
MDNFQYFMPTKVVFAPGAFDSLGGLCEHLGEKALLVTGKRSARASGALERICTQ